MDSARAMHVRSGQSNPKTKRPTASIYLLTSLLILMIAYFAFPIVWLLISSTKSQTALFQTSLLQFPKTWSLWHNVRYVSTFQGGEFWGWFANSVLYSTVISVGVCLLCAATAFALSRYSFKLRNFIFLSIIASMMVPATVLVIPVFMLEQALHIINTYWAVILPSLVSPFGVYFLATYMGESIAPELLEASRIDGCSEFRIFASIVLPIARPGILTLFIITFIGSWNNFFLPLVVLQNSHIFPLSLGLNYWLSLMGTPEWSSLPWYSIIITGAGISILPVIILFPFLSRYLTYGLSQGSVKG